ncbi:putative phosphoglycerate mutase [Hydrogenivirga caldilitoris]|uniref:Putative phosphoglycerate mutase n=1 Tax=Hydrogenivirga caldilitoris TaxID=246264 RepID=A0A497XUT8_9AQUI|nr:histidine phosphatase family protein [Hydrogenivirga caldilitoris]RLJ70912.1 putative phosphoglycerate mutase [Hydrogenivirga caldilitoris]
MLKLIIARHAESQWNPVGRYQGLLDPELTERGKAQAEALAYEFQKEKVSRIYSSPLKRTFQTAKIISDKLAVPLHREDRVIEIDHGNWSGMLVDEVKEKYPREFEMWLKEPHRVKFEGGESLEDVFRRVKDFLEYVRKEHEDETVIVVSHTVPIRCMYCALLDIDLSKFWSFGCDNASYSVVIMEDERNVLQKLNITCHLGELYVQAHKAL